MNHASVNPAQISSRGFVLPPSCDFVDRVEQLYEDLIGVSHVKEGLWLSRAKGIKCAKELFGNHLNDWLKKQLDNHYLYDRRLDFIVDTLKFIETGKRSLSVDNWYELLEDFPRPDKSRVGTSNTQRFLKFNPPLTKSNFISAWCSHPKGYEDMICTLNIIAGSPRSTDVPHMRGVERLTVRHL